MMIHCGESYYSPFAQETQDNVVVAIDRHLQSPQLDSRDSGAIRGLEEILARPNEEGGTLSCSELTYQFRSFEGEEACREEVVGPRKRGLGELEDVKSAEFIKRRRSQEEELQVEVEDIWSCFDTSVVADSANSSQEEELSEEEEEGGGGGEGYEDLDESTLELQMLCDDFGFEMTQEKLQELDSWITDTDEVEEGVSDAVSSGSARKSRRAKIQQTLKLLKDAIPGGGCMDSAIVLDETINYVKLLQWQVQTLVAQRANLYCPTK